MSIPITLTPHHDEKRQAGIRAGVRVEVITVVWMVIEALVAIWAGIVARSVLLTAFGLDSVVELASGGFLLWRFMAEAGGRSMSGVDQAENRAAWVTGGSLVLLCLYVVGTAGFSLVTGSRADGSRLGIGLAIAALVVMPWLVYQKRKIAACINSGALRADAACSLTCAYMAGALLAGVAATTFFGWWWADSVAALALLYWLVPEAREALEGARAGHGGCRCEEPSCETPSEQR